jgi:hypothetical protein
MRQVGPELPYAMHRMTEGDGIRDLSGRYGVALGERF